MTTDETSDHNPLSFDVVFAVVFHGVLWVVVLLVFVMVVPRFEKVFADFDLELPVMTQLAVSISHRLITFWPLTFLGLITCGLFDGFLLGVTQPRTLRVLLSVLLALIPIIVAAVVVMFLFLPLMGLVQSLEPTP